MKESPTLAGDKVTLRKIDPEKDKRDFYKMFKEADMHLWTGNKIFKNEEEAHNELKKYRDLEGLIAWALIKNETNQFIGTYWIAPAIIDGKKIISAEAQRIDKTYWRKGYTKEARKLVYDYAFHVLEVDEIYAQAWENNRNSCLSMEKAGFVLTDSVEREFSKYGERYIENHYVLKKRLWLKMKESLQG
ncbi:hypothetical protein CGZ90_18365 [Fictibacillus aquaticus]|uniref:N-acetyltransferase domain-containing protein n=2 Tax=Fictibacillus aquaticus TaxID=2021314 RepID=A0A235F6L7_9BACL|nr:hypothetical protein CGZ90_18365 [Fictibacillus aquaticus]